LKEEPGMKFFRWKLNMEARLGLAWGLIAIWTVLVAASLLWNLHEVRQTAFELARTEARLSSNKDIAYRLWGAGHGGVYVPATPQTPPNPYLAHIEERDVRTPSGRTLTLLNPAYMIRQVHELAAKLYGTQGHITSLKPIRPENAPDGWETKALEAFAAGTPEVIEVTELAGEPQMRLMRPFRTEKACLKCHATQGYKEGDIQGGISVAVPLKPYLAGVRAQTLPLAVGHTLVWILGLAGIIVGNQRIRRHLDERQRAEQALRQRTVQLEAANIELEAFSFSVSHDLKAPLRAIHGFTRILRDEQSDKLDAEGLRLLGVIQDNALKMNALIDDLLTLSRLGRLDLKATPLNMSGILTSVLEELKESYTGRSVKWKIQSLPPVQADASMIRQVWLNLLTNAIKFTIPKEKAIIEVGYRSEGAEYIFYVKDNGVGFNMEYANKLFRVFQRLHLSTEFEGTGVGLSLVQRIIHKHGGRVWAEGKVNEGAIFYFSLPQRIQSI
jgi:signal transduction histidine kinase